MGNNVTVVPKDTQLVQKEIEQKGAVDIVGSDKEPPKFVMSGKERHTKRVVHHLRDQSRTCCDWIWHVAVTSGEAADG